MPEITVQQVTNRRDLQAFVRFPWRVYRGDHNWVPPLISQRLSYLNPATGPFYRGADVALFAARRGREIVGTIASFVDHRCIEHSGQMEGGFGFFEVLEEYAVAKELLDAAFQWLRDRGMRIVHGPTNFTRFEEPGVLIEGVDCPPVMLTAHTPPYYKDFLEKYGLEKDHDLFCWRASVEQIGEELRLLPEELTRVADVARRLANATIRSIRMEDWDSEVAVALEIFNDTLSHLEEHIPLTLVEFRRLADQMRPFLNPDLAVFAEVDGRAIGFCVAIPDVNRVLIHLNGRLLPFNWLRIGRFIQQVDVVSFKLMGVLERYRRRGIDALLYIQVLKAIYENGYKWLDGSVSSELNPLVNPLAFRLGAELYKRYRLYQMEL